MRAVFTALLLALVTLLALAAPAHAQGPLDCAGAPIPTAADADLRLAVEPELAVAAGDAGVSARTLAKAKLQFDYCYGAAHGLGTDDPAWALSAKQRANEFAALVGASPPFQSDEGEYTLRYRRLLPTYRKLRELE